MKDSHWRKVIIRAILMLPVTPIYLIALGISMLCERWLNLVTDTFPLKR